MTHTRPSTRPPHARDDVKLTRWVATIAGLIGFVLSVATPLLPGRADHRDLNWPQKAS